MLTIVGAGGIGGQAGVYLCHAGVDVLLVDQWHEHVDAINRDGLYIAGVKPPLRVRPRATTPDELPGNLEAVALAVKSHHTEGALDLIVPRLAPQGYIISLQNGFNHELIAARIGAERTIGTVPNYGGALVEPGRLESVHLGPLHIGELTGEITDRIKTLAAMFEAVAPVEISRNIVGDIWGKQVYFSLVTLTALVDAPTHAVLETEMGRRLAVVLVREALAVSDAAGVRIDPSVSFDPALFRPKTGADVARVYAYFDRLMTHLSRRSAHGDYKFVKIGSGVWWDIVYRKRRSETRGLTGAVVERGKQLGVPVPINDALCEMIYEIEDGTRAMGWENVEALDGLRAQLGTDLP